MIVVIIAKMYDIESIGVDGKQEVLSFPFLLVI